MDLYQGNTPLIFFPFRLGEQSEENAETPDSAQVTTSRSSETQPKIPQVGRKTQGSPSSFGSEVNVNLFAEEVVNLMEKTQPAMPETSWNNCPAHRLRLASPA